MIPRIEYEFTTHTCRVLSCSMQHVRDTTLAALVNDRWEIMNSSVVGSTADDQGYDLICVTTLKRRVVGGIVMTQSGRDRIQDQANVVREIEERDGTGYEYHAAVGVFFELTKKEMGLK